MSREKPDRKTITPRLPRAVYDGLADQADELGVPVYWLAEALIAKGVTELRALDNPPATKRRWLLALLGGAGWLITVGIENARRKNRAHEKNRTAGETG